MLQMCLCRGAKCSFPVLRGGYRPGVALGAKALLLEENLSVAMQVLASACLGAWCLSGGRWDALPTCGITAELLDVQLAPAPHFLFPKPEASPWPVSWSPWSPCCFWFCSLGTSEHLTSPTPALLLLSPTHPQRILASVLLWILQNCFSPVPLSAAQVILFCVTLLFLALVVVTVPVQIPATLTAFPLSVTVVRHWVSAPSLN